MTVGELGVLFQQKRKMARGDIRAAVDKEKGKSRQKTRWFFRTVGCFSHVNYQQSSSAKSESGDKLTMKNMAKKFPTGLVANWQNKMSKTSDRDDSQFKNHQRASSPLGGLEDDDAHGERPDSIGNRYKTQARRNDVCFLLFRA